MNLELDGICGAEIADDAQDGAGASPTLISAWPRPRVSGADAVLGSRVRDVRRARGVAVVALAKLLGVTPQQVNKYELGENRISAVMLARLARVLRVRPEFFLSGLDQPVPAACAVPEAEPGRFADEVLLLESFSRLRNQAWRARVIEFVAMLEQAEAAATCADTQDLHRPAA